MLMYDDLTDVINLTDVRTDKEQRNRGTVLTEEERKIGTVESVGTQDYLEH